MALAVNAAERGQTGQVLVMVALLLPLVILPVAAYAVESAALATRGARLQEAAAQAALDAAQGLDEVSFRSGAAFQLQPDAAVAIARTSLHQSEPEAVLDTFSVRGTTLVLAVHEPAPRLFGDIMPGSPATLRAAASARLTPGYTRPSSRLLLPTSSF